MIELTVDERQYVLARLDREHLESVARQVRDELRDGYPVEACYMPGDGTWYSLVFVPLDVVVGAPGGGTRGQEPHSYFPGARLLVVYSQRGTLVDLWDSRDLDEAASTLADSPASAVAIAELLKAVTA